MISDVIPDWALGANLRVPTIDNKAADDLTSYRRMNHMTPNNHLPPLDYELTIATPITHDWRVHRLHLTEALNAPYHATLDLITEDEAVDTDALLGADATLTMSRGDAPPQHLHGVITEVEYLRPLDRGLTIRVHLAPAFELLRQRVDSRIWQDASVQDIVAEVLEALGDYDRDVDFGALTRGASPRDYCVQYRESDLDYVARLLEEEGISYLFTHADDDDRETLILRDDNAQYPAISDDEGPVEFLLAPDNHGAVGVESIQRFEWIRRLTSTSSLRRDYDWLDPDQALEAEREGADQNGITRRVYAHADRRLIGDELDQRCADLQDRAIAPGAVVRGSSNASCMRPGFTFRLADHEHAELAARDYLVTRVVHRGWQHAGADGGRDPASEDEPAYSNEFHCVPTSTPLRPPLRTPKPRVHGPQTALVVGANEGEPDTDEHGRVRVRFHWQTQASDVTSCWLRCAQAWAGGGWGAQFIPRVGTEVVVEFLDGNPDRPLVVGCVQNGANASPFPPETATQSGWRTRSCPGGDGFNELRFDDAKGAEEVHVRAQRDWRLEVGHDGTQRVDNNLTRTIGSNETVTVAGEQTVGVLLNRYDAVGLTASEFVGIADMQIVGGLKTEAIGGLHGVVVGGFHTLFVGAGMTQAIGGCLSTSVGLNSSETVVGSKSVSATTINLSARRRLVLDCGRASIVLDASGKITISGTEISVAGSDSVTLVSNQFGDGTGRVDIESGEAVAITTMGEVNIDAKGDVNVDAMGDASTTAKGNVSIKATGNVSTRGQKVSTNG